MEGAAVATLRLLYRIFPVMYSAMTGRMTIFPRTGIHTQTIATSPGRMACGFGCKKFLVLVDITSYLW